MAEHVHPDDQPETRVETVTLTPAQHKARRTRSIALAIVLGLLAVLFFVATLDKLGANLVGIDAMRDM